MNEGKIIVGLDIGTTKVACIVGQKAENGKIEILGYGKTVSTGVRRGVVTNIFDTVEAIKTAVKQASDQSGVEINRVSVGIAGQHIKSLQHRGVMMRDNHEIEITEAELERLRNDTFKINMTPGEEIIDVIRQDTYVDGELATNPVGMLGNKIEANFHVIIGQTSAAKNIVKCIESAGLEMDYMILEPIASAQAVLDDEEKDAGVVLVDIGGGTTDIAIFKDKKIQHTAVIPFGGNIITEDICTGCSIIKHYAEEVKVKFGSALASENRDDEVVSIPGIRGREPKEISFKNLANIIQARLEEIFELVNYEIQKAKTENQLIAGIVLTGGGAMMRHIQQLAEFKTGLEVRIGYPNEHLNKTTMKELSSPMYSTSIGIVIETIARMDHDEYLKASQAAQPAMSSRAVVPEETVVDTEEPEVVEEREDDSKKKKKKGIDLKKIVVSFTEFFTPDNIE
ncbi:MAG: cell division protein FtsA [bacterium F082]|nr:MAG: cell division protein FtsA [bacterium F082]KWW27859.1 MAG: cell division protein FtsA [bacterium P201]